MARRCTLLALVLLWSVLTVTPTFYSRASQSLTSLPDDIPSDVTTIDIHDNRIENFDNFPELASLVNLTAGLNDLDAFPDLVNVSGSIRFLDLSSNWIASVPAAYLDQLTVLEVLTLYDNPLTGIPDVAGPADTLGHLGLGFTDLTQIPELPQLGKNIHTLYLHSTRISSLSLERLDHMPNLARLTLDYSEVTTVPNLCRWLHAPAFSLELTGLVLDAGIDFVWLKVASGTGRVTLLGTGPSCRMADGTVVAWDNVDINAVTESGADAGYYQKLTERDSFRCYPEVYSVYSRSPSRCAWTCLQQSDCTMFATDNGQCLLTTLTPASSGQFLNYNSWFSVK